MRFSRNRLLDLNVIFLWALLLLFPTPATGSGVENVEAYYRYLSIDVAPRDLSGPWGAVTSVDDRRAVPTFLFTGFNRAARGTGSHTAASHFGALARHKLYRLAHLYHLDPPSLATAFIHQVMDPGRGGVLVAFRQHLGQIPVVENELKFLFKRNGELLAMSGRLHPAAKGRVDPSAFLLSYEEALAEALADRMKETFSPDGLVPYGTPNEGFQRYVLRETGGGPGGWTLILPARVRKVLYPLPSSLAPAYEAEFLAGSPEDGRVHAWRIVLAAADGEILQRRYLTFEASYRVWAQEGELHTPRDGPLEDISPHPTGVPDGFLPEWTEPILVHMEGFNHGPDGEPDPWLPPGETRTRGNNARVFIDLVPPDGFGAGDMWGTASSPGMFDYFYDDSLMPYDNDDQLHAAAVQAFYTVNWLHNYFYDSGFDEVAGNAQESNYGRGGLEGDPLIVQVEGKIDGWQNNASVSPLGDGMSPFIQNALWQASPVFMLEDDRVRARGAFFGAPHYDLAGPIVLMQDDTPPVTDGCSTPTVSLQDAIVLIDRGACTFASKAHTAQEAGALAVIIANNQPGQSPQEMSNTDPPFPVSIPVISISFDSGQELKSLLAGGPVSATLFRDSETRQGALDSGVIAHEWGHYMHLRLVQCGNAQCYAMSEGFADFIAGFMTIPESADPMGTYATGVYSIRHLPDAAYFGIRRVPYSSDFSKNALVYRHVADGVELPDNHPMEENIAPNSEVHNAGEVWGTMMHDLYMIYLSQSQPPNPRFSFSEARRRMADVLVLGMAMAPQDTTFTEQRDAILAAAMAHDQEDFELFAEAFARRGMGTCALAPPRDSMTFTGLEESYISGPGLHIDEVTLDDGVFSCDDDGILDAGEIGNLNITLLNTGTGSMEGATVEVKAQSDDVSFPGGGTAVFGTIAPFERGSASVEIALSENVTQPKMIFFELTVSHPDSCEGEIHHVVMEPVNHDELLEASKVDHVESRHIVWTPGGTHPELWERRSETMPVANHFFHGDAIGTISDIRLESPILEVSEHEPLVFSFNHRHRFEESNNTFWDGGVVEISTDEGATWEDVALYASPSYGGTISDRADNPLSNRQGYVGDSPGYPNWVTESMDLGMAFAGQNIKVRFRIGTDQAVGDYGWDVDDIGFSGIDNKPFPLVVENARSCFHPRADAGPDQVVTPGAMVTLDGTASRDPEGATLTFRWSQLSGEPVTLDDAQTATPGFTAPMVEEVHELVFELTVSNGDLEDSDQVTITVDPSVAGDGGVDPDVPGSGLSRGKGCQCRAARSNEGVPFLFFILLAAFLLPAVRRIGT